jgi:bla regulator protein blaR1
MRTRLAVAAFTLLLLAPVLPIAQTPAQPGPQFEVASIKPNKSGDGRVMLGVQPGGRFTATNVPLRLLIRNAYQLQDFQIVGGPSWIADERFDIVAKAEAGDTMGDPFRAEQNGQPSRGQLMMRALLADRFKLVVHNENKEMPIYALVLARSDGKLGPQLKTSETDCAALIAASRARGGRGPMPPVPPPGPGAPPPQCGVRIGPGNMAVGGSPMAQVATSLAIFAGRIVVDKTGLAGNYDFTLSWTPDQMPGAGQRPPGAPEPPPIDPNGPSLFTAVQEQLGLKLDSQRGPVAMLVIDRAERPTEN